MNEEQRLKKMCRLWCKWNRKELSGDEFAHKIGKLYEKEALESWNSPLERLLV